MTACEPSEEARALAIEGHDLTPLLYPPDPDSSEGLALCSCGWESRSVKSCWIDEQFAAHIAEVSA